MKKVVLIVGLGITLTFANSFQMKQKEAQLEWQLKKIERKMQQMQIEQQRQLKKMERQMEQMDYPR